MASRHCFHRPFIDTFDQHGMYECFVADQVWAAWDAGLIPDQVAAWAWWLIAAGGLLPLSRDG